MKKLLTIAVAALALAGCGSTTQHSVHRVAPQVPVAAHSCSTDKTNEQYTMQCALPGQAKFLNQGAKSVFTTKYGIDFAWSCPSPGANSFGASYLSPDPSKNWTRGCVNEWHSAGKTTVPVWESSANRAEQGFSAGFQDAFNARSQARFLGMPDNRPIDYAVDCDCALGNISGYFQGVDAGTASVLHVSHAQAVAEVGVYGGFSQVGGLHSSGLVGKTNWQTYAWSFGQWQPASIAPLEQYNNQNAFDYDRAIAPDFGQWPYKTTPVGPSQKTIKAWRAAREGAFSAYHTHGCTSPQDPTRNATPASFGIPNICKNNGAAVISNQQKLWTVYKKWSCFGKNATKRDLNTEICWVVRPSANYSSGARHATWKSYEANKCLGAIYQGRKGRRPICTTLSNRWRYFNAQANGTVRAYS